jgi:CBS domain-containing protein
MKVSDILTADNDAVVTIGGEHSIAEAAGALAVHGLGAVVVMGAGGKLAGIISERDIVRALNRHGAASQDMRVDELMTSSLITCEPENLVDDVMKLMTKHGIRHLPVLQDGALVGVVGILSVVRARLAEVETDYGTLREFMATRIE